MSGACVIETIGQTFGFLTAIAETDKREQGSIVYLFRCKCGNQKEISGSYVRRGKIRSCGCLKGEPYSGKTVRGTVLYRAWCDMKQRCYNSKNWAYKYYGERGISVCDEWKDSFLTFAKDMGERPEGMSLDRIDNNGNYCKENCKWSTKKEQVVNRRPSIEWRMH